MSESLALDGTSDFERRFGGLRRLYGVAGAQRIFDAHAVVVGIGGVGSWTAEGLARSGVRRLTLIDLDHISESNFNRQIHANELSLGQSKVEAMRERIKQFHPACEVEIVDDFVTADNWSDLAEHLERATPEGSPLAVIDACDQIRAKTAMAAWAIRQRVPMVCVGAAGGKRQAQAVEVDDLSQVSHDPLLAKLRYQLRRQHGAAREGRMRLSCVFSREAVAGPDASCDLGSRDGSLGCHGYGSVVSVTAAFGMSAAGWALNTFSKISSTSFR